MTSREELLIQMEEIASQLVVEAEQLKKLTLNSFTEQEIDPMQQHQEQLIARLIELDASYRMHYGEHASHTDPALARIKAHLDKFQMLNDLFVENVRRAKGVIQFESEMFHKTTKSLDEMSQRLGEDGRKMDI